MSTSQRASRGFDRLGLLASPAFSFVKRILAGIVLTLMLKGGAVAGPFEDGLAAADRGDYATALRLLRPLAEQGNALAQYNLGVMYDQSLGVPQDYAQAVKWYRLAAEQGYALAQYNLGVSYEQSHGVPQDYAQAVKWYRLAAEQGNAGAQYNLGNAYQKGLGVPKDYAEAAKWYRLAAEQGTPDAQLQLGLFYSLGKGVPQDHVLAHFWTNLAASRFSASDAEKRDRAIKARGIIASMMTPAQIGEAQMRHGALR